MSQYFTRGPSDLAPPPPPQIEKRATATGQRSSDMAKRTTISHERFIEELNAMGVREDGGRCVPPQMVRDMALGFAYANGAARQHVDSQAFALGARGSIIEIADECLRWTGGDCSGGRARVIERAMTTSDFTAVLTAVGDIAVRAAYEGFALAHRVFAARTSASNFKPLNRPLVAGGQVLEEVPESGRVQQRDGKIETASYAIKSYGGILPLTRKLLINDDFGLFDSLARQQARAAAETERKAIWDLIESGIGTFWSVSHGNTSSAASNATVSATTLNLARTALRSQLGPDGVPVAADLRYIVAGPGTETAWDQLLNGMYVPQDAAGAVTPSMRRVELLVDSSITDNSWLGFADHRLLPAIEYAYLAGNDGPQVSTRPGFSTDGIELKVILDFGAGLLDHRGTYRLAVS